MMKQAKILFLIGMILFINIRSTKEKNPNTDLSAALVFDSVRMVDLFKKYEASLKPRKYIYLTIDDAPLNGSAYIDSIISVEKVKTSLFVVGSHIKESKRLLKSYESFRQNPYIEIYNHSYSHANNRYADFYKNPNSVYLDFERNQSELNISRKIARLPGRDLWMLGDRKKNVRQTGTTAAELLAKNGYDIFGWDVEWNFDPTDLTPKQSIDELIAEIEDLCHSSIAFTPNHIVLLIHNQMFGKLTTKNSLQELIEKLKDSNYSFEYLSSYSKLTNSHHKKDTLQTAASMSR